MQVRRPRLTGTSLAVRAGVVLVVALLVRAFVVHPGVVESSSMTPTLSQGDVVLVVRPGVAALVDPLARGDLVTAREPGTGEEVLKRVAGLPGDVVAIADGVTTVDGVPVDEPWLDGASVDGLYYGPVTVPPDAVLLLGDHRARSIDSRDYGPVPVTDLTGRVTLRIW